MKSIAFLFYPKNFVFEENICENSTFVFHQKVYLFPISSIAFQFYPKNFVFGEDWREYLWKFNFCISQKVCFLYPTQPGEKMCSEGFVNKLSANCSPQVESSWIECIQELARYMHTKFAFDHIRTGMKPWKGLEFQKVFVNPLKV